MAAAHKKVIVRRFLGDALPGYLEAGSCIKNDSLFLLDLQGRVASILLNDVKHVCYVRDFNLGDPVNPERLTRRAFLARPRSEGLWVRVHFRQFTSSAQDPRSPDLLEGLASTDLALLDDMLNDTGLYLTPPDTRSNTQRLFVPRSAINDLQILAVITAPSRRKALSLSSPQIQEELFSSAVPRPS